jgi:hypothetical protein
METALYLKGLITTRLVQGIQTIRPGSHSPMAGSAKELFALAVFAGLFLQQTD